MWFPVKIKTNTNILVSIIYYTKERHNFYFIMSTCLQSVPSHLKGNN
jgi:hypothetical protein